MLQQSPCGIDFAVDQFLISANPTQPAYWLGNGPVVSLRLRIILGNQHLLLLVIGLLIFGVSNRFDFTRISLLTWNQHLCNIHAHTCELYPRCSPRLHIQSNAILICSTVWYDLKLISFSPTSTEPGVPDAPSPSALTAGRKRGEWVCSCRLQMTFRYIQHVHFRAQSIAPSRARRYLALYRELK